jgi:hypothetical protein
MSPCLLQRLVIITTAVLFFASASLFNSPARGDDQARSSHESAVLDRIFVNWKARHDRVHSLHFSINSRTLCKKGQFDFSSMDPNARFDRDQIFQKFGEQVWIDGDDRLCVVATPTFKLGAKSAETHRVATRWVHAGKTFSVFSASRSYETGVEPPQPFAPRGFVRRNRVDHQPLSGPVVQPLLLTFRPQSPWIDWQKDQCHLHDENAVVEEGAAISFQRAIAPTANIPAREETCWVSPSRDEVVVHWRIEAGGNAIDGSIKHKKDKVWGWVPSEWTVGTRGEGYSEYSVTNYAINENIDPAVFSQTFPPGTPVVEESGTGAALKVRHYVVQPDRSERAITPEEFRRLTRVP